MTVDVVGSLAEWVVSKTWESVPGDDQQSLLDSFVDTIGVALAGAREPVASMLARRTVGTSGPGRSRLWAFGATSSAPAAALVNGASAMAQEFDDRHTGYGHPSCVIVPALLAASDDEGLDGGRLLRGYAVGVGAFAAVGRLYRAQEEPRLEPRGWHITSIVGTVAAAAGVSAMLGSNAREVANALGIAASMAGGLSANVGSPTKALHAGRAAAAGVEAVVLGRLGLTSAAGAIDGPHGAMMAFGHRRGDETIASQADVDEVLSVAERGTSGLLRKRFPTFGATHLAIEAALELRRQLPQRAVVTSARLTLPTARGGSAVSFHGRPATPSEARHSFRYVVALTLAEGTPLPCHFEGELFPPQIHDIWNKLDVAEELGSDDTPYAELDVVLADGTTMMARRVHPPQSISADVVDEKFLGCAAETLTREDATTLLHRLRNVGSIPDTADLFAGLGSAALATRASPAGLQNTSDRCESPRKSQ